MTAPQLLPDSAKRYRLVDPHSGFSRVLHIGFHDRSSEGPNSDPEPVVRTDQRLYIYSSRVSALLINRSPDRYFHR